MSGSDLADCWRCPTHRAIRKFASTAFDGLARKVAAQLRRTGASGIYGDDQDHKTLWDEYCYHVRRLDEAHDEQLDWAWDQTIYPFLVAVVDSIPHPEAQLLTIGASWELDEDDKADERGELAVCPDFIHRCLEQAVIRYASEVNMSHSDPSEE